MHCIWPTGSPEVNNQGGEQSLGKKLRRRTKATTIIRDNKFIAKLVFMCKFVQVYSLHNTLHLPIPYFPSIFLFFHYPPHPPISEKTLNLPISHLIKYFLSINKYSADWNKMIYCRTINREKLLHFHKSNFSFYLKITDFYVLADFLGLRFFFQKKPHVRS